jgi:hypothetical protein
MQFVLAPRDALQQQVKLGIYLVHAAHQPVCCMPCAAMFALCAEQPGSVVHRLCLQLVMAFVSALTFKAQPHTLWHSCV